MADEWITNKQREEVTLSAAENDEFGHEGASTVPDASASKFVRPQRSVSIRRSNPDSPIEPAPHSVSRLPAAAASVRESDKPKKGLSPRAQFLVFLGLLFGGLIFTLGPQLLQMGFIMMTLLHANQPQQVIRDYDIAISINPKNAELYVARANIKFVNKDISGAMDDYALAIKTDPKFAMAWMNRGLVEAEQGLNDAAIADYNKSLEIDPGIAVTYNNRALSYADQGKVKEALADYAAAIKINPQRPLFYSNRARLLYKTGDYWQAEKDLTKLIELTPNDASAYSRRAKCYQKLGKQDLSDRDSTESARLRGR